MHFSQGVHCIALEFVVVNLKKSDALESQAVSLQSDCVHPQLASCKHSSSSLDGLILEFRGNSPDHFEL